MRRDQLEHIIRAAGAIMGDKELIIIGSQSILGKHPTDLPPEAERSVEADVLPITDRDGVKADLIEGSIGEGSPFHETFGIFAQGVDEITARLPAGWRERLIPIRNDNTWGITGYCLEPHDLLISKYLAGRPKDLEFCAAIVRAGLVQEELLLERLKQTESTAEERRKVAATIYRHFSVRRESRQQMEEELDR